MGFNKILALGALILLVSCNSSDSVDLDESRLSTMEPQSILMDLLFLDKGKGLIYYQNTPFTGTAITKYTNDSLATSVDYVVGKRNGWYKKWFENGMLSFQSMYKNGKQEGKSFSWWSNGNLRSESNFSNGKPDGIQLSYYKSGAKFKKIQLVQGKEEGIQQSWRENGKLYNNYEAKNGRIFGLKRSKLCFQLDDEEVQY